MEAIATAKGVRIAPRKARLVIDLVRGKSVAEADKILNNINKEAARLIRKVLTSAVANAENNLSLDKTKLYVKEAYINEGQTMKRMRFWHSLTIILSLLLTMYCRCCVVADCVW